jgi:hypothetical protein
MSHGQNNKKRASDFDTQNVFYLPKAAINARHSSHGRKPNIAQHRLIMPPPQQLDAVDGEFYDEKFDLYNNEEKHLTQDSQRQSVLKRNRISSKNVAVEGVTKPLLLPPEHMMSRPRTATCQHAITP